MLTKLLYQQARIKADLGWSIVSPDDIIISHTKEITAEVANKLALIPYCIDFKNNALIHVAGLDPFVAAKASFQYVYLRQHAENFLRTPIPAKVPKTNASPVILFSTGRCGSTLLAKITTAMGVTTISEPDFYSQAVYHLSIQPKLAAQFQQVTHMTAYASTFLLSPFMKSGATKFLIKTRSQVNYAPQAVLSNFSTPPKTIFLMRDFHSWCISRMRVFNSSLESNLRIYIRAIHCLRWIKENHDCLIIHYEDLQSTPEIVVSQLADYFEVPLHFENIKQVLKRDSQEDTALAKNKIIKQLTDADIKAITDIWSAHAPYDLLKELNLGR